MELMQGTKPVCLSVSELSSQTGWSKPRIYEYAGRHEDPLPLRFVCGSRRGSVVLADEFNSWLQRNSTLYSEVE